MDCHTRRRAWTALVLLQDGSIALILTALTALLVSTSTLQQVGVIFVLSFMLVRFYHRFAWIFFNELVNNRILRKYLFGNNAK